MTVEIWKCPKCKIEAKIDRDKKKKEIVHIINPEKAWMCFPTHPDCELVKPVRKMDFSKLTKRAV